MDKPWKQELWLPTVIEDIPGMAASAQEFTLHSERAQDLTRKIQELPYDLLNWCHRACVFKDLGYPELWIGDAHKARLLVEAALNPTDDLGHSAWLVFGMKMWMEWPCDPTTGLPDDFLQRVKADLLQVEREVWTLITEGLGWTQAYWDARLLRDAIAKTSLFSERDIEFLDEMYIRKEELAEQRFREGKIDEQQKDEVLCHAGLFARPYPWMSDMLHKGDNTFQRLDQDMKIASQSRCRLVKSNIRVQATETTDGSVQLSRKGVKTDDVFGIVAAKDLWRGEEILTDESVTVVTNLPDTCEVCFAELKAEKGVNLGCCDTRFCTKKCADKAKATYHKAVCGKTFELSELKHMRPRIQTRVLLILRILAMIVQAEQVSNPVHPLLHPAVNYLSTNYNDNSKYAWSYLMDIILPNRILQTLGVDIFADLRFDTWVLHTLHLRMTNNASGHQEGQYGWYHIHPLYTLFNHSCHPNVAWDDEKDGSSIVMRMKCDVKKDEELLISYKPDMEFMDYEQRQMALRAWFGGDCGCPRCKAERLGEEEARKYYKHYLTICLPEDREIFWRQVHGNDGDLNI
ncbi:hypothetical protein BJ170DRAFT_721102 [Xylariales sp. AK1849]|nr:hypothetical protein BJ170DRAFT_721102 [Xylariales sp. AK1849]